MDSLQKTLIRWGRADHVVSQAPIERQTFRGVIWTHRDGLLSYRSEETHHNIRWSITASYRAKQPAQRHHGSGFPLHVPVRQLNKTRHVIRTGEPAEERELRRDRYVRLSPWRPGCFPRSRSSPASSNSNHSTH